MCSIVIAWCVQRYIKLRNCCRSRGGKPRSRNRRFRLERVQHEIQSSSHRIGIADAKLRENARTWNGWTKEVDREIENYRSQMRNRRITVSNVVNKKLETKELSRIKLICEVYASWYLSGPNFRGNFPRNQRRTIEC